MPVPRDRITGALVERMKGPPQRLLIGLGVGWAWLLSPPQGGIQGQGLTAGSQYDHCRPEGGAGCAFVNTGSYRRALTHVLYRSDLLYEELEQQRPIHF